MGVSIAGMMACLMEEVGLSAQLPACHQSSAYPMLCVFGQATARAAAAGMTATTPMQTLASAACLCPVLSRSRQLLVVQISSLLGLGAGGDKWGAVDTYGGRGRGRGLEPQRPRPVPGGRDAWRNAREEAMPPLPGFPNPPRRPWDGELAACPCSRRLTGLVLATMAATQMECGGDVRCGVMCGVWCVWCTDGVVVQLRMSGRLAC